MLFRNLIIVLFLVGSGLFTKAFASGWDPVDPKDLALKQCLFDKSADSEILFEKNDIEDTPTTIWNVYRRVKIFNRAGAEKWSNLVIKYPWDEVSLRNLRVRVIHPDGTVEKVDSTHITNEMSTRSWGGDERRRVVAIPQVVPGSIIEYRYQFSYDNGYLWFKPMVFQFDSPARDVEYLFRPMDDGQLSFESLYFNMPDHKKFKWKGTGYVLSVHNMPPVPDEPLMLPDNEVHSWVLSYYTDDPKRKPDTYWRGVARDSYNSDHHLGITSTVRRTAAKIVRKAKSENQKARLLYAYCQSEIRHLNNDGSGAEGVRLKDLEKESPTEAIRHHRALRKNIDKLFLALCRAAGLEARTLRLPDRSQDFFSKTIPEDFFLPSDAVMVKTGKRWCLCDPSLEYLPFNRLRWQECGEQGLMADPHRAIFLSIPMLPPKGSMATRNLAMTLDSDGTLHGRVRLKWTGYLADSRRKTIETDSKSDRDTWLRNSVTDRLSAAKVTDIVFHNLDDPSRPLECDFSLSVPDYAERVGSRLIFQPAIWEKGLSAKFPSDHRLTPVYFSYRWAEIDQTTIKLPKGFHPETSDTAKPLKNDYLAYEQAISYDRKADILAFGRGFVNKAVVVKKAEYGKLKAAWDSVARDDQRPMVLKADQGS